jgi:hypothetical protein
MFENPNTIFLVRIRWQHPIVCALCLSLIACSILCAFAASAGAQNFVFPAVLVVLLCIVSSLFALALLLNRLPIRSSVL